MPDERKSIVQTYLTDYGMIDLESMDEIELRSVLQSILSAAFGGGKYFWPSRYQMEIQEAADLAFNNVARKRNDSNDHRTSMNRTGLVES